VSDYESKATELNTRVAGIDAQVAALDAERKSASLPAANGNKDALKTIARVDGQIEALLRERAILTSATAAVEELIAAEAVEAEQRAQHERLVKAGDAASAIVTLHEEIDTALAALRQLFERRAVLLRDLGATEVASPLVVAKLASKGGATAAAQAAGLNRYVELTSVPNIAARPLADANSVLLSIRPKAEEAAR
jgi:hypothetical protein